VTCDPVPTLVRLPDEAKKSPPEIVYPINQSEFRQEMFRIALMHLITKQ